MKSEILLTLIKEVVKNEVKLQVKEELVKSPSLLVPFASIFHGCISSQVGVGLFLIQLEKVSNNIRI